MSELLKKMRMQVNLSQKEVAQAVGVKQSTISRIESNCSSTSYKLILKIYLYLRQKNYNRKKCRLTFNDPNLYEFFSIVVEDSYIHDQIVRNPRQAALMFKKFVYENVN